MVTEKVDVESIAYRRVVANRVARYTVLLCGLQLFAAAFLLCFTAWLHLVYIFASGQDEEILQRFNQTIHNHLRIRITDNVGWFHAEKYPNIEQVLVITYMIILSVFISTLTQIMGAMDLVFGTDPGISKKLAYYYTIRHQHVQAYVAMMEGFVILWLFISQMLIARFYWNTFFLMMFCLLTLFSVRNVGLLKVSSYIDLIKGDAIKRAEQGDHVQIQIEVLPRNDSTMELRESKVRGV